MKQNSGDNLDACPDCLPKKQQENDIYCCTHLLVVLEESILAALVLLGERQESLVHEQTLVRRQLQYFRVSALIRHCREVAAGCTQTTDGRCFIPSPENISSSLPGLVKLHWTGYTSPWTCRMS